MEKSRWNSTIVSFAS